MGNTQTMTLSSSKMRNMVHDTTLCRINDREESISLDVVEHEKTGRLNMKKMLMNDATFNGFMRHLVKVCCVSESDQINFSISDVVLYVLFVPSRITQEYSSECLLSIIEMTQYKEWVFNKQLSTKQRKKALASKSSDRFNTELWLELPPNIPQSRIMYAEEYPRLRSVRDVALQVYRKYVKRGAFYEINLQWQTRNGLSRWMESDEWEERFEDDYYVDL